MKRLLLLILALPLLAQTAVERIGAANTYCADAGASDTYACNLSSTPAAYVTGALYSFKANTANTGAATINFSSKGAKTIVKVSGGITTALADNDILAGQVVTLIYDGTNMQMQSTLGNVGGAPPDGSALCVQLYATSTTFGSGCAAGTGALIGNPAVVTGSELVTNGGFTGSTTGWTLAADVAYGTNNVVCTLVSAGCGVAQSTIAVVTGNWYRVQFTISAANAPVFFYSSNSGANGSSYFNGTHNAVFKSTFTGTVTLTFDDNNYLAGDTWTLTGVSIKQISASGSALTVTGADGLTALSIDYNLHNVTLAPAALSSNTTGAYNVALGFRAMPANTIGNANVAVGVSALLANTEGSNNTAIATQALQSNTTGNSNTALGNAALWVNTEGSGNTATGNFAISSLTTGNVNTAYGNETLVYNVTGSGNVALGNFAGAYELGSNSFYVDNQDRSNSAGDKAGALLYGTFNGTPASQTLTTNSVFKATYGYKSGDGSTGVTVTTCTGFKNGLCISGT